MNKDCNQTFQAFKQITTKCNDCNIFTIDFTNTEDECCICYQQKNHKSYLVAQDLREHMTNNFPETGITNFALTMPEEYKTDDPVESYRRYYI